MTIECYYGDCRYHGTHDGEEGPFCFEAECKATEHELKLHGLIRKAYENNAYAPVVAWRYRYVDPKEGPSVWSVTTDAKVIDVITNTGGHEIQPLKVAL